MLACGGAEILVEIGPGDSADDIDGWLLRPPGDCGGETRCGFVSLRVDPDTDQETTIDSAARTVAVTLSGPGEHRLQVEFRTDDGGSPDVDGGQVSVELDFVAELPSEDDC